MSFQRAGGVSVGHARLAGNRVDVAVRTRTMAAVQRPAGIAHLEDPTVTDQVQRAEAVGTDWVSPGVTMQALAELFAMRLAAAGAALLLFGFAWWAPLLLFAAVRLRYRWSREDIDMEMQTYETSAAGFKRASYLRDLTMLPAAAKEIRVFGLANWLVQGFRTQWPEVLRTCGRRSVARRAVRAGIPGGVGAEAVVLSIALRVRGDSAVGEAVVYTQASLTMGFLGHVVEPVRRGNKLVANMRALEGLVEEPRYALAGTRAPAPEAPQTGIRFEDVSFRYPGRSDYVFRGLNLWVPAGRSLAIVGENGAGKTTCLKLLSRLYDPESGRITVDGVDLRELNPSEWQRRVAAIFQDFVRFELTARENVRLGGIEM